MILRNLFGMAHRVDLVHQHGEEAVEAVWGRPAFPNHPCVVDPSRIAGLDALRDALEMLMRYIVLVEAGDFPIPQEAPRSITAKWFTHTMILAIEQHEFRRQQQMQQLRWIRHLVRLAPDKTTVWAIIVEYLIPPSAAGLMVGGADYHAERIDDE